MANEERIVKRSDKLAFMNTGTVEKPVYTRMRKFTDMSTSKNPTEYTRQYVDEDGEETDVTGYSEEKSYGFDQYTNNPVHERIVEITDDELKGDDAIVEIVIVDKSKQTSDGTFAARKRRYTVVPDGDGDSTDAYTYSGSFRAKGAFEKGTAKITSDGLTATYTPSTSSVSSQSSSK